MHGQCSPRTVVCTSAHSNQQLHWSLQCSAGYHWPKSGYPGPWLDREQTELRLHCLHMIKGPFLHAAAQLLSGRLCLHASVGDKRFHHLYLN